MWLGALTMHLSADGSRPASSAAFRAVSMIHWMMSGSASWMITPSPDAPGDGERLRPVAGDVHLDLRQLRPHPLQLELLLVPRHLLAVHERLDHLQRCLEVGHLHRLAADVADRRVAAADAHDHPAVRDVLQRRVRAREHRRVARRRVRDHVAELDPRRLVGGERHHGHRLLPEHVRVVRPAVLEALRLGELHQLDQALVRRIGQDGDAEAEHGNPSGRVQGTRHSLANPVAWQRGPTTCSRSPPARCCRSSSGSTRSSASWVGSPVRATLRLLRRRRGRAARRDAALRPRLARRGEARRRRRGGSGSAAASAPSTCSAPWCAAPKLGAAALFAFILAGQAVASLAVDHFGWVGFEEKPITPGRAARPGAGRRRRGCRRASSRRVAAGLRRIEYLGGAIRARREHARGIERTGI